jgi:CheY-like chemotaxis protein
MTAAPPHGGELRTPPSWRRRRVLQMLDKPWKGPLNCRQMSRWLLLIDDDQDNRELLSEFLELGHHVVMSCGSAAEADSIIEQRGRPCLVLSDVRLPDTSGTEFVERLKARPGFEKTPVIFVTGADPRSLGPLSDPIFVKPLNLEALSQLVSELCPP